MLRNGFCVLVLVVFTACGGSSSGGGGDNAGPLVTICFPSPVALTNAATITVRGTATDGAGVAALDVNGTPATTTDGFANWQILNFPLALGLNLLTVNATDGAGNNDPAAAAATVTRDAAADTTGTIGAGPAFNSPQDLVIDQARNRLLVVDDANDSLAAVDLATSNRTVVSAGPIGGGTPVTMDAPVGMADNFPGSVVYVTDDGLNLVIAINIISGIRAVVSDSAVGPSNFPTPRGIAFESNRFYLVDQATPYLISALVTNGNTRVVESDNGDGGPNYVTPYSVEIDISNNRALITENVPVGSILAADLTTGTKTLIASGAMGTGGPPGFSSPRGLALDLANNRCVTQLSGSNATVYVNLANGNRTTISSPIVGNGPAFVAETSLAYDPIKLLVYVTDNVRDAVFIVDAVTGDRAYLTK